MTDKKIPLHEEHVKLGAKMVPFGGYIMPVQYKLGILKEHKTVRESVGIFDISHMGEVIIKGKDAESFLQYIMVNDLKLLYDGKAQYSCICYDNGTVVDDCFYYRYSPEEFRIILNASNIEKDIEWFNSHKNNFSVTINDVSKSRGRFALQGPKAKDTIAPLIIDDISELKRFHFMETKLNGIDIFIAFTGYTGENGYEISFEVEKSIDILHAILKSGEKYNISLIGLGARDTLRLEACYSLYGH
ncbi:MAG: glycine cleavage system aminomethyltransferase GcvT, partial [archaeon]|nr:glycine cleavage system aminomethyltransferase GcvT [archaeon]